MSTPLVDSLETLLAHEPVDLARLALVVARVESPRLDPEPVVQELARMKRRAREAIDAIGAAPALDRITALNHVIYEVERFHGDEECFDDVRNSLLHVVIERRAGIPITLAVVYISLARDSGIDVAGVSFPGHFLLRVTQETGEPLILDPFNRGQVLRHEELRHLLSAHVGPDAAWNDALLDPCSPRQIAIRLLNNLKRQYVSMRSFDQAWRVTDALVEIGGRDPEDVRDRGLLAYHLDNFPAALADLEAYVQAAGTPREGSDQRSQIWEHLSALRRRVAAMN